MPACTGVVAQRQPSLLIVVRIPTESPPNLAHSPKLGQHRPETHRPETRTKGTLDNPDRGYEVRR